MRYLLACDYSSAVGYGHLRRCENLAFELGKMGREAHILFRYPDRESRLPYVSVSSKDCLLALASKNTVLIIDDHLFPLEWASCFDAFRLVVSIDETGPLRGLCRLNFFTTLLGLASQELVYPDRMEYCGVEWFVLPELSCSLLENQPAVIPVTFGGSDPAGLTERFAKGLQGLEKDWQDFLFVIGPGFGERRLHDLIRKYKDLVWQTDVTDLSVYFRISAIMIGSGGITAFEALNCGCLPMLLPQHEEQAQVISGLRDQGLAILLGDKDNIDWHTLHTTMSNEAVQSGRQDLQSRFQKLCPPGGAGRLLAKVMEYAEH